ncbi:J domain-containing protein [Herbaspirillum rubrisubalbicans]|uniref:Molecular chaperone DnaJ n=1 Tax=Herbaspirillum rubrisubalbicans TaxID=80842 RepID=A0AAD0U960_9BURK|nr:J domain-containing protein [Herbaspirillum rubrisubalbicans]AYR22689.1 molecular chaperone DnaJ [Herbaspirillum rubrisubalbicans]
MKKPPQALSISDLDQEATLSHAQKRFNDLIKQIGKRRAGLLEWESAMADFQKKYVDQFLPLDQELQQLHRKLVQRLHEAWSEKGLTKGERAMLSEIIADMAHMLLGKADDPELKLIYNQHSASDYDLEARSELDEVKQVIEEMLDIDLGDDLGEGSPEEIMQRMEAILEQKEREQMAAEQAREERRASRKKSPRQRAAEVKQETERKELSQSIREVYRKLASALHPDREPDASERQRKTLLMQQVNQAYEKNDLLKLLELQLELEHIDQHAINGISTERLKHYNQILKEQLGELDQEVFHVEQQFKQTYGLPPSARVSAKTIVRNLNKDMSLMRDDGKELRSALASFADVQEIKVWLRLGRRRGF